MELIKEKSDLRKALVGGGIAALIIGGGSYAVGSLGQQEALDSIEEMRPSLRFTCAAVLTSTSTILALLLTLLSFSGKSEHNFKSIYYHRVQWIAQLSTAAFVFAVFILLSLNIPLVESSENLYPWYVWIYHILLISGSLLGGLLIAIVLMLYQTATAIIILYHPDGDSNIIISPDDSDEEKELKKELQEEQEKNENE